MTAVSQPRVPAGAPGGGRFAPRACRTAYAILDALAAQSDFVPADEPAGNVTVLHVVRCPHGSFPRYAAANCCRPAGSAAPDAPAVLSDAQPCTGTRANGDPCGQRTTYRFRGRPACHHHGGVRP